MLDILLRYDAVFWDFDGVLMDSNPVRDFGFAETLAAYPQEEVNALLDYHRANGGLSRYVKFRYFFEVIRKEQITDAEVGEWALRFSGVVKKLLLDPALLIDETFNWVKQHHQHLPMHIVSGSDQSELREVCSYHAVAGFFKSISGSPTPKKQLVAAIISEYGYNSGKCVLVGDSVNDFEAAQFNGMHFFPYNNSRISSFNTCI